MHDSVHPTFGRRRWRGGGRWVLVLVVGAAGLIGAIVAPALSGASGPSEPDASRLSCSTNEPRMEGHVLFGTTPVDGDLVLLEGGFASATDAFNALLSEQYPGAPLEEFERQEVGSDTVAFTHAQGYVVAERVGAKWVPAVIGYCQSAGRAWVEGA